ncbi:MAG: VWA domain-containing protein [Deltaproteobacteria bacterium]|nr:VWA domain-containing protein [Deltaproteobacteria bacterium]
MAHPSFSSPRARFLAAGCVALAAGGIVLLRAPRPTSARSPVYRVDTHPAGTRAELRGPGLRGRFALSHGAVLAGGARQVYATVDLTAEAPERTDRRPVAFALVLDTSGSMDGDKIVQARNAVSSLVQRMEPGDRVALVTYSDTTRVLQPLRPVGEVREALGTTIATIVAAGGTQIPDALDAGARALAEAPEGFVRRVVLVSDGQDGSGVPLSQVQAGVRVRAGLGVTLSSLGIGADYQEAFLSGVADAGRGNYEFLQDGSRLQAFLAREIDQAASTVAEQAVVELRLPDGWRLRRAYGTEPEGATGTVRLPVGALFARDSRRLVLDLVTDPASVGSARELSARVAWRSARDHRALETPTAGLTVRAVGTPEEASGSRDVEVYAQAETAVGAELQNRALVAWREGRHAEATSVMQQNMAHLRAVQAEAPSPALAAQVAEYERDRNAVDSLDARSEEGRSWSLRGVSQNRARQWRSAP